MAESTITQKGQTTVPQQIRDALGVGPGTKLLWYVLPDGSITVRAKSKSILELAGMLKAPKGKRVPIDKMNAWR
ncbi:MAG: AbrB/MazE/SpoVT family DNA-binding domain-containing protein [Burkholderiales bacterium]|jgi:antitoxin PrlF